MKKELSLQQVEQIFGEINRAERFNIIESEVFNFKVQLCILNEKIEKNTISKKEIQTKIDWNV